MESVLFRYRFRSLNADAQVEFCCTTCILHFKLGTNLSRAFPVSAQRATMDEFDLPYKAVNNMEFEVFTWHLFIVCSLLLLFL